MRAFLLMPVVAFRRDVLRWYVATQLGNVEECGPVLVSPPIAFSTTISLGSAGRMGTAARTRS
ncbi:MAG TPA: hypothetical protein VK524_10540 [Polyangiaceae bacterium]|nr:hypothetical protein [Polyangiaceae bacterium]